MPWPFLLIRFGVKKWRQTSEIFKDLWLSYLLICVLSPLVFFTFARNIIYPYVFPILPFFALLIAEFIQRIISVDKACRQLPILAAISGIIFLLLTLLFIYKPNLVESSQKRVVKMFNVQDNNNQPIIYWAHRPDFSARFYTYGSAQAISKPEDLNQILNNNESRYLVLSSKRVKDIPQAMLVKMHKVGSVNMQSNEYMLLKIN